MKPQKSPADLADLRRQNPKTTITTIITICGKGGVSKLKFTFRDVIVCYYNNGKAIFAPCLLGKYGLFLVCENNILINCKLVNPKIEL